MTAHELIDFVNHVQNGTTKPLVSFNAFAVNTSGYKGVAIESNLNVTIHESFNRVQLANADIEDEHMTKRHVIFLYTEDDYLDEHYGMLCLDFLNKDKRQDISNHPYQWFREWCELLGNSIKSRMIFDVIGEMRVLNNLVDKGLCPKWDSIEKNTFDISADGNLYEVKTSTNKTETFVTIHNQFQLDSKGKDNLYIVFVRVEQNDSGDSIDSLFNDLKNKGYNVGPVSKYLDNIGYCVGTNDRYVKYTVHEIRKYKVDDKFPKITKESFINNQFPDGIVKLEYTVSLDGLSYESL